MHTMSPLIYFNKTKMLQLILKCILDTGQAYSYYMAKHVLKQL